MLGFGDLESIMNIPALLFLTLSTTLVLRSGDRITADGPIQEQDGQIVFRLAGGPLYSIPLSEVDLGATEAASASTDDQPRLPKRLRVSPAERDRLLRELEKSHSGQPAPRQRILEEPPPPPETLAQQQDEWSWRHQARGYEERVRHAQENLQLLVDRVERLKDEIRGLLSLGFHPNQFSYQTTVLQLTLEQIPVAELSVVRAQRAYDQFRDDARRMGVMPGWLR